MYLRVTIKPNINACEITEKMKNSARKKPRKQVLRRHVVEIKTINFFLTSPPLGFQEPDPSK